MKSEDKIVELLAESLKKQDQMAEILTAQGEKIDTVVDVIKDLASTLKHNTMVAEKVVVKFEMLNDHERRIAALERRKKDNEY